MGIVWSYLWKKASTKETLKKIQDEIQNLEEYKEQTEQTRQKLVFNLVAFSSFSYVVAGIIWWYFYLPTNFQDQLFYFGLFSLAIILIYLTKNFVTCYYKWKVRRNEKKLLTLKAKKEDILDQVMETETYKVAKDILETFAPEQIKKGSVTIKKSPATPVSSVQKITSNTGSGEVRRRIVSPQATRSYAPSVASPIGLNNPAMTKSPLMKPVVSSRVNENKVPKLMSDSSSVTRSSPAVSRSFNWSNENGSLRSPEHQNSGSEPPGPPMPRPILPRERGVLDRFIEYLVGDGPSNRYALVCKQCESHNGMALREEFPYIAFRCAYCYYWNPARKQKPAPPKLDSAPSSKLRLQDLDNDSDEEDLAKMKDTDQNAETDDKNGGTNFSSKVSKTSTQTERVNLPKTKYQPNYSSNSESGASSLPDPPSDSKSPSPSNEDVLKSPSGPSDNSSPIKLQSSLCAEDSGTEKSPSHPSDRDSMPSKSPSSPSDEISESPAHSS